MRIGYSGSVQALPLLYPLLSGWTIPPGPAWVWRDLPPSELLTALDNGELDAALIAPVAQARRQEWLAAIPGVGLASEGANAAAALYSPQRPDLLDGGTIRLPGPPADDAGAALLAVLLQPYFGIRARFLAPDAPASAGAPSPNDAPLATVLTGDAAVAARRPWLLYDAYLRALPEIGSAPAAKGQRPPATTAPPPAPDPARDGWVEDLAAAWWVLTGAPLVWAVGVVRKALVEADPALLPTLSAAFADSRRVAAGQWPSLLAVAAARVKLPEEAVATLWERGRTELGPREMGGLAAFYSYTRRVGLTR